MHKHLFLFLFLWLSFLSFSFAQTKVEKYCQVVVGPQGISRTKRIAKISYGENKWLFTPKDTSLFQQLNYVNSLTTEADVLNYMSHLGWTFVNVHSAGGGQEWFYFKKEFDAADWVQ
ncbi:MAG TPA: hypothetical protein VFE53_06935 [Mucilaginibacter sp.]|nr:hypothetical protein [Mucilaginibacter sp.]